MEIDKGTSEIRKQYINCLLSTTYMNFSINDFVKVTKLESCNNESKNNEHTWVFNLDDKWFCEGFITSNIKVGERFELERMANYNNPKGKYGWFNTSIVNKVEDIDNNSVKIYTQNSIYLVERKEYNPDNYKFTPESLMRDFIRND